MKSCEHLSDRELLLAMDGELSGQRKKRASAHLAACGDCRSRQEKFERLLSDTSSLHRSTIDSEDARRVANSRAALQARLTEAARPGSSAPSWRRFLGESTWGSIAAMFLLASVGVGALYIQTRDNAASLLALNASATPVPITNLTPGAVRSVSRNDVCRARSNDEAQAIPVDLQQKVFREYGLPNARPADYELDYLITPELGGATDIRNLWPEPHAATEWNSYVKDALEQRLHDMVCRGQIDLPTAQRDISTNWIAAYKKYFHTSRPLSGSGRNSGPQDDREPNG